jgi:hypothetical protein
MIQSLLIFNQTHAKEGPSHPIPHVVENQTHAKTLLHKAYLFAYDAHNGIVAIFGGTFSSNAVY